MKLKNIQDNPESRENIRGKIRYFNLRRKYGIVDSNYGEYIFFITGFCNPIPQDEILGYEGRNITFSLSKDTLIEDRLIATNIVVNDN